MFIAEFKQSLSAHRNEYGTVILKSEPAFILKFKKKKKTQTFY